MKARSIDKVQSYADAVLRQVSTSLSNRRKALVLVVVIVVASFLWAATIPPCKTYAEEPAPRNDLLAAAPFIHIQGPNPILVPQKDKSAWDHGILEAADAFKDDNTYYLYYHAKGDLGYQIGVATSESPLGPFKRYGDKPILAIGKPGEWDDKYVACAAILKERSNKYYMYYSAKKNGRDEELGRNTYDTGVATADNPLGPWTKIGNKPLIPDFGFVGSVVKVNGRYFMFSSAPLGAGGEDYDPMNRDYAPLSVATADHAEGPWTINSKPVMRQGQIGEWDDAGISESEVLYNNGVFHLFYSATPRVSDRRGALESIGYAYSFNGLDWHKYGFNPVVNHKSEANVSSYSEVHTIFEPPFIYLYHTLRYEKLPEHAKEREGFPWLEDLGVQVLVTQRPFSLDMPILTKEVIHPLQVTTFSAADSKTISLGSVERASLSVSCHFSEKAARGLRVHMRASPNGEEFDSVDIAAFEVPVMPGKNVQQSFKLDPSFRFQKVLIENLDKSENVSDVKVLAVLEG
jgi:predicted GH43/DUF377 family glycosyl hydrolase